jgi:predicted heme/steroid binding protein
MVDPPSRTLPAADLGPALEAELGTVPAQDVFLGPEELSERLHAIAGRDGGTVRTLGRSREGRPIECLTIGDGRLDAVVFGLPHPNEPIGGLTALHLADRLAAGGALGLAEAFRWHVVPCVDPDGLALNRGWLRGPYTLAHYARHFYRPAGDEQVEWTFPFHYKRAAFDDVLPETRALMGLIDGVRPTLMCSLHNSEFGGAYFYLSRREPALYGVLAALPGRFGVDLHAGEAEAPFIEVLSDGVHLWPGAEEGYDYTESLGLDPVAVPSGSASSTYAGRHGTLTVVSELPYWRDPRAGDTASSGRRLDDALRCQATDVAEVVDLMTRGLASVSDADVAASPLLRASAYFAAALASAPARARRRADEATSRREGSVAEIRSVEDLADSFRLRYAGMLRRGLESLPSPSHPGPILEELAERHEAWLRQAEDRHTGLTVLPIGDLVAVQYGAILAAGHHLARPPEGLAPSAL